MQQGGEPPDAQQVDGARPSAWKDHRRMVTTHQNHISDTKEISQKISFVAPKSLWELQDRAHLAP